MRIRRLLLPAVIGLLVVVFIASRARRPPRPPARPQAAAPQRWVPVLPDRERPVRERPVPEARRAGRPKPAALAKGEWQLSPPPGFHRAPLEVAVSLRQPPGLEVRFTTDGSDPRIESPVLDRPIAIERSTVIRAAGFRNGAQETASVSASYFIGRPPPLPVLSISIERGEFEAVHLTSDGRGRDWERPAFLEVIGRDGTRTAAAPFGLRLHGGAGRQGGLDTKKAYRLYFRKAHGQAELEAPLFAGSPVKRFKELVLRSGYNDRFRPGRGDYNIRAAYLRDEVMRETHLDMGAPAARGTWCLLFVDMEPRGLYNLTERPGADFLSSYLGGGEWDVIKTGDEVQSGSDDSWRALLGVARRSMAGDASAYEELRGMVDLDEFTSYILLNLWGQNYDWAYNNWYAARKREPGGQWIFLAWDAEWSLGLRPPGWEADSFAYLLSQWNSIRTIFAGLLAHKEYRDFLLERARAHQKGALASERVLARIARQKSAIAPVMEEEMARFAGGYPIESWRENVAAAETFARERGPVFLRILESRLAEPFRLPEGPSADFEGQVFIRQGGVLEIRPAGRAR